MSLEHEKKTDVIKAHVSERLYVDLARLAAVDDRSLSEYIGRVLSLHVYGHAKSATAQSEGPDRP